MSDKICVVGLGYVGLPLAVAFAEHHQVLGFDVNEARVVALNKGVDDTKEVESAELNAVLGGAQPRLSFSNNVADSADCTIYIVTVPTPIDSANRPDLSPLIMASQAVGSVLNKGDLVIYESTVYPGVTEDVCVVELEKASGLVF